MVTAMVSDNYTDTPLVLCSCMYCNNKGQLVTVQIALYMVTIHSYQVNS